MKKNLIYLITVSDDNELRCILNAYVEIQTAFLYWTHLSDFLRLSDHSSNQRKLI